MTSPAPLTSSTSAYARIAADDYEERTAERRRLAAGWRHGDPLPAIAYTPEEHAMWRSVTARLSAMHQAAACSNYLSATRQIVLPESYVPQLAEVSEVLRAVSGFRLYPAAGVVPARTFLGEFADLGFYATQYLRPSSAPFHSPEPDIIHELVGHAVMLADPLFAELYQHFGRTTRRTTSAESVAEIARVFWFALETGVIREEGELRACGAAILSSVDELNSYRHVELRDFDVAAVLQQEFSDKQTQPILFVAESAERLSVDVRKFLDAVR